MSAARSSVPERAAKHAALADQTRLRIVDLLALGDLTVSELERALEVPSNLLAHHLNRLEATGLILRSRSEGDRRRSYVRLALSPGIRIESDMTLATRRVVFVCTANSARSQLAERLWRDASDIPSASAGTVPADRVAPGAVRVAAAHGLDLTDARPRLLDDIRADGDLYITVCDNAHEATGAGDLHWSIPDPVAASSPAVFEETYAELDRRVRLLAPHVIAA